MELSRPYWGIIFPPIWLCPIGSFVTQPEATSRRRAQDRDRRPGGGKRMYAVPYACTTWQLAI